MPLDNPDVKERIKESRALTTRDIQQSPERAFVLINLLVDEVEEIRGKNDILQHQQANMKRAVENAFCNGCGKQLDVEEPNKIFCPSCTKDKMKKNVTRTRPANFCKRCIHRRDDDTCDVLGYDPGDYAVCDRYKDWESKKAMK